MVMVDGGPLTSWLKRDRDSAASRQIIVENMLYLIFVRKGLTGCCKKKVGKSMKGRSEVTQLSTFIIL